MTTRLYLCKNVENNNVHKNIFSFSYKKQKASVDVEQFGTNCNL